jgi:hypothetical protein
MNISRLKSTVLLTVIAVVVAGVSLCVLARPSPGPTPSSASPANVPHFEGGVVCFFRNGVSDSQADDIISSVHGTVFLRDPELHMVVIRFNPPLKFIREADQIAATLQRVPEVQSAAPEMAGVAE